MLCQKLRNRRPQSSLPGGDQSAPSTVPTFDQLRELTLNLDKAAPLSLDDEAYPYEAINCVQYFKQASFGQPRPFWVIEGGFFFFFLFFSFFSLLFRIPAAHLYFNILINRNQTPFQNLHPPFSFCEKFSVISLKIPKGPTVQFLVVGYGKIGSMANREVFFLIFLFRKGWGWLAIRASPFLSSLSPLKALKYRKAKWVDFTG